LPLALAASTLCYPSRAEAQILEWQIEGTIIELDDPDDAFSMVRLGDPVRGFLRYDLQTAGDDEDPNDVFYGHDQDFEVVGMVIENPRDGGELKFVSDKDLAVVQVLNDQEDEDLGVFDTLFALQSVVPPDGFGGVFPVIGLDLGGPADVLPNANLPAALDLDDWPDALLVLFDYFDLLFGSGDSFSSIAAEIHTLTPVARPPVPGDLNDDGTVDAADYVVWRKTDGTQTGYDAWRSRFGSSQGQGSGSAGYALGASAKALSTEVPEPATASLMIFATAICRWLASRIARPMPV
jgi:hypothetical protein